VGKLYFNQLVPAVVNTNDQDASYPASNLALQSIDKEYRSSTNLNTVVQYDFVTPTLIAGVLLEAHNFEGPTVDFFDVDVVGISSFAALKSASDPHLRRRSIFAPAPLYARLFTMSAIGVFAGNVAATLTVSAVAQGALANKFWYARIWTGAQVIASGDSLRYDVFVDPASIGGPGAGCGGIEIDITTTPFNGRTPPLVDGGGASLNVEPVGARAGYVSRVISLTPFAGKTISSVQVVAEADSVGTIKAQYRNIRIVSSGLVDKLVVWRGGSLQSTGDVTSAGYYVKKISAQGAPFDAAAFYRCSAMYAFGSVATIKNPEHGVQLKYEHAEIYNELPNKKISRAQIGTRGERWSGRFLLTDIAMLPQILQAMRTGVFAIDWEHTDYPWAMAPLRCMDPADVITFARPGGTEVQFSAMEVV
jgi:hypothetical protein